MKAQRGGFRVGRHEQLLQEVAHDSYKPARKLSEGTRCRDCGAVYRRGRWSVATTVARSAHLGRCPACRRTREHFPAGYISLKGDFYRAQRDEILALVRHCEADEKGRHLLERIMAIREGRDGALVTTTGIHLARRIADAVQAAYKGRLRFRYNKADKLLRAYWSR